MTSANAARKTAPEFVEEEQMPAARPSGMVHEEPLIFEMGVQGRVGVDLPEVPDHTPRLGKVKPRSEVGLPDLSEPQMVRHYTRLS
jgi:glycine dehydrogenase subunit 2